MTEFTQVCECDDEHCNLSLELTEEEKASVEAAYARFKGESGGTFVIINGSPGGPDPEDQLVETLDRFSIYHGPA